MQVNGNGDISIEIGAYSKSAAENISQLTASLKELKNSASGGGRAMSTLAKRLSEVVTAANKLSGSAKKLKAISEVFNSISNLGQTKIPKNLGENLTSVADAAKGLDDSSLAKLDKLTTSLQKLSGVDISGVKTVMQESAQATSFANAISQKSGKTTASPIDAAKFEKELRRIDSSILRTQKNIEKFNEELDRQQGLENADEQNVKNINSALEQETEILNRLLAQREKLFETGGAENFAKSVKKASSSTAKFSGRLEKLVSAFKRVVFYRVVRTIIKEIGDAFREGVENAYYFSQATGGDLAKSFDSLSTKSLTLKNQLGAAFATLIQTATPALIQIAEYATRAANAISQFIAALGGKSTYLKAIDYAKEWGDTAKSNTAAAKEWKNQLMGFDEINRLDEPTSGGGASALDYSKMFEETKLDEWTEKVKSTVSWIKDNFDSIMSVAESIGLSILAWEISQKLMNNISALTGMEKKGLSIGVSLIITGIALEAKGIKDAIKNKLNNFNFNEIIGGETILTVGGASLGAALGSAILGAAIGAVVGGIPAFILAVYDAIKNGINVLNGLLIPTASAAAGAGIGAIIGSLGGPVGAGIGALIGLGVGLVADGVTLIVQKWDTIKEKWDDLTDWLKEKWESFKNWWKNLELPSFKIKLPHLSWTSQPASGWISNVLSALGLPTSIPKLDVNWYAQGGVFDKASLIGVGEAGKEAVVPLERNTEWIGKIASQLDRQMGGSGHMASDLEDANGIVVEAIFSATADIVKAISKNNGGGQSGSIDIERIARDVTTWQRRAARANG